MSTLRTIVSRCSRLAVTALAVVSCSVSTPAADNAAALQSIAAGRSGAELVVEGPVTKVLPTSSGPNGLHQRFVVNVRNGVASLQLFVADNITVGAPAPVRRGDDVIVKGELAFNRFGPVLHWTHRDPRMRHVPGFVEVGGRVYE